jgi:uncharacterized membrane protein YfcA
MDALLTAAAGLVAGAVNAVAGGGTLIAFPALLAAGLPAVTANITSSTGLVTGYAGGALGYRRELSGQRDRLLALAPAAILGGVTGAVILLVTPKDGFKTAVPFLVLTACVLLASQTRLSRVVARRRAAKARPSPEAGIGPSPEAGIGPSPEAGIGPSSAATVGPSSVARAPAPSPSAQPEAAEQALSDAEVPGASTPAPTATRAPVSALISAQNAGAGVATSAVGAAQRPVTWPTRVGVFLAGAYGSYFGAGLGVLLLAVLGILLVDDLQRTNALKTLLSFVINAVGVLIFLVSAQVAWAYAGILVVTSAAGGVAGARAARLLPAVWLRRGVITLGTTVAVILFIRDH